MKQRYFVFCRIVALSPSDSAKASLVNRRSILRLIFTTLSRDVARFNVINWRANDSSVMTPLPSKQRARRAKHCPISRGWRLTTDRQSAWMAVVHCRPRSLWRHYECRQLDASTDGTAPGQQYSPPSLLQRALTSPLTPRIPFTAVDGCSEWNARRGRTGASRRRRQSVALAGFGDRFLRNETGHRFEKRVPVNPVTVVEP